MKLLVPLLSVSSLLFLSVLTIEGSAVYDTDGEKLVPGQKYNIVDLQSVGFICHHGFFLEPRNSITCPPSVSVIRQACDPAATFSPVDARDTVVQLLTDVNIEFPHTQSSCVNDLPVWMLGKADEATGRRYVTTGGVKGNPGEATVMNWFKITKSGLGYKLLYCPTVCPSCDVPCGNLGIYEENGKRWLGLSEVPFQVAFVKSQPVCPAIECLVAKMAPYDQE